MTERWQSRGELGGDGEGGEKGTIIEQGDEDSDKRGQGTDWPFF